MQSKPGHPIRVVPHPARVRVLWNGKVVADTMDALRLYEASYPQFIMFRAPMSI